MATATDFARYPAGHPLAGKIIIDSEREAEEAVVAAMDAMPDPAPRTPLTPPAGSRFARSEAPERPPEPPAGSTGSTTGSRFVAPIPPGEHRPLAPAGEKVAGGRRVTRQQLLVAAGALVLLAVFAIIGAWGSVTSGSASPASAPTPAAGATAVATPFPSSSPSVTALPPDTLPRAIVGWFDFQRPDTAVALDRATHYRIIGRAGTRWLMLATDADAHVWVLAEDVGLAVDPSLPDLAPRPTAVPPAPRPAQPAASAPQAPAACTEATAQYHATVAVPAGERPTDVGGYGGGWSCVSQADANAKAQANADAIRAQWGHP